MIIIKLECNEIRKLPVVFYLFLNLEKLFQAISPLKNIDVLFPWVRPLSSKIPSSVPVVAIIRFLWGTEVCLSNPFS